MRPEICKTVIPPLSSELWNPPREQLAEHEQKSSICRAVPRLKPLDNREDTRLVKP
uniref:Uncharacterized protein n=1 Tax=Nelumbo nucifera TaxID=4432 RepID=A0A822ZV19_NELNU|nr:TPA_asm: hypothetical protein HUJ06_019029 [Nelumbo nucifera]